MSHSGSVLTLNNVNKNSVGTYLCEGKDEEGNLKIGGAQLIVDGMYKSSECIFIMCIIIIIFVNLSSILIAM